MNATDDEIVEVPKNATYPRWNCYRGITSVHTAFTTPAASNGDPIYHFFGQGSHNPTVWWALLLTKVGDVETNPGPTNTCAQKSGFVMFAPRKYILESRHQ